uniref:Uncharacterized protein n=1 Tax=Arundo donax TaxID=35708 RepID=A0A0A9APA3_ARUDO
MELRASAAVGACRGWERRR